MQRHVKVDKQKPEEKKKKKSNMKWWITAGVLAFVSVCAFIGVTVWLGLNIRIEDNNKTVIRNSHLNREEVSLMSRTEEEPVVLGTADQKFSESSQQSGSDDKYTRKKENDEIEMAAATGLFGDMGEEAFVEEVHKPQTTSEDENGAIHNTTTLHHKEPLTSGSPLYPQPIPETPAFIPEDRTAGQTVAPKTVPTSVTNSRPSTSEHESTPVLLAFSSTGMNTGKKSDVTQEMFSIPEHNTEELRDALFQNPTEETKLASFEEDIADAFLGQENKDIRRFDIGDAVNVKGEHFMPQNFDYPHDRDFIPSQHFDNQRVTESLVREHVHEITEDGVNRDGIPSLGHEDGLFYVPSNPDRYDGEDPDLAENPFTTFLQGRLQELYNWLSTDEDLAGKYNSDTIDNGSVSGDFMKVLVALNRSLYEGNSSILLGQLKDMYYSDDKLNVTDPAILHNSSNLVTFGLLAFDLLLLRNVQQIAWEEEKVSTEEMMKDPEVLALNALFMPPEKVRQLQEPTSRIGKENKEDQDNKSILQEMMEFLQGSLRAVLNLGRAYRSSVVTGDASRASGNALDCIWTLYCTNLDKTASLRGPYGFLAKMNSLGLQLLMGEVPVENALEHLLREVTQGWSHMDCEKLFPRCNVTEATDVVLKTALGITGDA